MRDIAQFFALIAGILGRFHELALEIKDDLGSRLVSDARHVTDEIDVSRFHSGDDRIHAGSRQDVGSDLRSETFYRNEFDEQIIFFQRQKTI